MPTKPKGGPVLLCEDCGKISAFYCNHCGRIIPGEKRDYYIPDKVIQEYVPQYDHWHAIQRLCKRCMKQEDKRYAAAYKRMWEQINAERAKAGVPIEKGTS